MNLSGHGRLVAAAAGALSIALSALPADASYKKRIAVEEAADTATFLATGATQQTRFTLQAVVFQCFAELGLDAVVYATGNIPPAILTALQEPTVNDRSPGPWTYVNSRGFPALTVPAGFTTIVYDRDTAGNLLPAKAASLPVGIDFLGLPFEEPKLFTIGAAYEALTKHRIQPPGFGPLDGGGKPLYPIAKGKAKQMPTKREFSRDEMRAITEK